MLKIRLSRTGKKSQPNFRVVVQEHTSPIKGKFVEVIGQYRPTTPNKECEINLDRAKYWLSVGAQPSDTVAVLLKKLSLEGMEKFIAPRNKKRKPTKEVVVEAPAPAPVVAEEAPVAAEEAPVVAEEAPAAAEEAPAAAEEAPVAAEEKAE